MKPREYHALPLSLYKTNIMKAISLLAIFFTSLLHAQEDDQRIVLVPMGKAAKEAPLFYSAAAEINARVGLDAITSTQKIDYKIHQGKPETLTLSLAGAGDVVSVTGEGLRDWSVRAAADGSRFLDVRPALDEESKITELHVQVETRLKIESQPISLLLPGPGPATGFSVSASLTAEPGLELRIAKADGLVPVDAKEGKKFLGYGDASLEMSTSPSGTGSRGIELTESSLAGKLAADGNSISYRMTATARAIAAGSAVQLFGSGAALSGSVAGEGWHVVLKDNDPSNSYDLIAERAGEFPVALDFIVPVSRKGDWRFLSFQLPSGVVVPMKLENLGKDVTFDRQQAVVPEHQSSEWRGFLPANGDASMAWREAGKVADGALFFSSSESSDIRIGSGLMRQLTVIDLRVLQGKLANLSLALDGPGEVLAVKGEPVLGWSVVQKGDKRQLEVKLSRPIEGSGRIIIEAQSPLGGFPVKAQALRMIPEGSLRHSGWLRVANEGAVRVEVADAKGLIQLAPGQFPGGVDESLRQVFVYRFPSADYGYEIRADQVLPEVGVTEVTVYEVSETDRRIFSDLELDIREAPLREWELEIPADYAVASVTGAEVADYAVASEATNDKRRLKVIFKQPVIDRQLVRVRLEKNEAAKAGDWKLQPLGFPGVKSRRGSVGAVATAGYRLIAGKSSGVAEMPITFFTKKTVGLQLAFRLREDTWNVSLSVEALDQRVQADVFHLYSLKAGAVYGSVLINYFVVGAPATEWKISVPDGIGNIDVTGQNVGRDWRRDGNTVIVPLSRPVLGTGTVLLTFEQPMNARGGELTPGVVRPLDVQAERGYVQVVSPLQVKFAKPVSEGPLLAIDPSELPAEFRLLSSAPTLAAWQYTARDFKIGMKIEWFEPGETVGQVVDFLKLSSQVSRDGQWVTDARFFVKSKGRSALKLTMPKDVSLWEAKVDGEAVNARDDGDQTLVPLPSLTDPNKAVEVTLRYGGSSANSSRPRLAAPRLDSPVVIGEWNISGDENRRLLPRGGTAELIKQPLAESGWEWLARQSKTVGFMFVLGLVSFMLGTKQTGWVCRSLAILLGLCFIGSVLAIAVGAAASSRGGASMLEYAAPVVASGSEVVVELDNVAPWQARVGLGVWLMLSVGVGVTIRGIFTGDRIWKCGGLALAGAAFLSIRGGAALFFLVLALVAIAWWLPRVWLLLSGLRRPKVVDAAVVLGIMAAVFSPEMRAAESTGTKSAESMVQDWQLRDGRLRGKIHVTLRAETGDRFLLLREPAVLSGFVGNGLRVVKAPLGDSNGYFIVADAAGRMTGDATFEMPLANPAQGWSMPGGPAAVREVTVRWDQGGWEFFSPGAAKVTPLTKLAANESGAVMVIGPADPVKIQARPVQRDASTEETRFFAEVSNLYLPGPGVVNGRHRIAIRPAQGRVALLVMKIPDGFTVSDVVDGPVGPWRFDPDKRELRVPIEPAQDQAFALTVETQRGAGGLPMDLELEPIRVNGAAGEIGFFALAFGNDSQAESIKVEGLSQVNPGDFSERLLPRDREGRPLALLQNAYRYGSGEVKAQLKVTAVAPELRSDSWELVTLGEDRISVTTDLTVEITRSGVFRLSVEVPEGLEIEAATGEGLSHWTDGKVGNRRVITLHLNGKTIGKRTFSLTMSGHPTGTQTSWQVPRISLLDSSRETGVLIVVPERGMQVIAANRKNVSQLDPRELVDAPQASVSDAKKPGALAYRMLQSDWSLGLAISRLDPWVTAKVYHEATLREGQMLSRVVIGYKIENASLKVLRVRIPGLDATAASTVRANGSAVAALVPVKGEDGLWEIQFQSGVTGDSVELEYQRSGNEGGKALIEPVTLENVSQFTYFAAIRAGGRMELEAGALPRGWQKTDWAVIQSSLDQVAGNVAPQMAFRVADPEGPLPVILKRNELTKLEKLRVAEGSLTTLMSPDGDALTAVDLKMQVVGKGTLSLTLPKGAALFNVLVNEEGATLVREGDKWLFYVFPSPEVGRPATVRFVYSAGTGGGERLEGPVLNVPMEKLTWRVLVPEGWEMTRHGGDFDLKEQASMGIFRLEDYQSFVRSKKESDSRSAVALLDQANGWLAAGDQQKASEAFSNAVRSNQLDAASGEDAKVQLRELKTQQAVLGLNTRRQKLVLDNRSTSAGAGNAQLERAVEANPVLRGGFNYDPKQFDRFLEGNTADEIAALKDIANRIVNQQLADPPPVALDVTIPERGTVLTFGRSVQVDGERPMAITLALKRNGGSIAWLGILVCLLLGAMGSSRMKSKISH